MKGGDLIQPKAIYGLAIHFADHCNYEEHDPETNTFRFFRFEPSSIRSDGLIGITLEHDFGKCLGRTDEGDLSIYITDIGLYFRLIPTTPAAMSAYKRVKRNALRHCSFCCKYEYKNVSRNTRLEAAAKRKLSQFIGSSDDNIVVETLANILLYEICLTNSPANQETFCTTDVHDKRLAGIDWNHPIHITEGRLLNENNNKIEATN